MIGWICKSKLISRISLALLEKLPISIHVATARVFLPPSTHTTDRITVGKEYILIYVLVWAEGYLTV